MHRSPMLITGFKQKKSGGFPILADFVSIMDFLIEAYKRDVQIIKLLDYAYTVYKDAYSSFLNITYAADKIENYLKRENSSFKSVMQILGKSRTLNEFLSGMGKDIYKEQFVAEGCISQTAKMLSHELRVRNGRISGNVDLSLNKYFNRDNTLNARGLKLIVDAKK